MEGGQPMDPSALGAPLSLGNWDFSPRKVSYSYLPSSLS